MNTKDAHKLFLLLAIFLGGALRVMPVAMAGFPINDGGMFYVMVKELQANHFLLPAFTQYNLASIPYAYPPIGFYATGLISSLLRIPALDVTTVVCLRTTRASSTPGSRSAASGCRG